MTGAMDLLEVALPTLTLRPRVPPGEFFDRCEHIAGGRGYRIDRRRAYAGAGFDQLNLYLGSGSRGYPMLRMVSTPRNKGRLSADVVAAWKSGPIDYDEYLNVAKSAYAKLLREYAARYSEPLRLGVPRRPIRLDLDSLDCHGISYAEGKFNTAVRSLAVGEGDARKRVTNVFSIIHVVRPEDLPPPLDRHLAWVYGKITSRPACHRLEGSVESTLDQMRNSTASEIAQRILDLADALSTLEQLCRRRERDSRSSSRAGKPARTLAEFR